MKLQLYKVGQKINCWTVVQVLPKRVYFCKCNCGNTKKIRAHDLSSGKSKSCRSCSNSVAKGTHGSTKSLTYSSWLHMIDRCTNPKSKDFESYGKVGITVCDAWIDSFEAFEMTVGKCPGVGYTIDRIDNAKGYTPGNCKWSDKTEQSRNRTNTLNITYDGRTQVASAWIEELGITNPNTFYKRVSRNKDKDVSILFKEFIDNAASRK